MCIRSLGVVVVMGACGGATPAAGPAPAPRASDGGKTTQWAEPLVEPVSPTPPARVDPALSLDYATKLRGKARAGSVAEAIPFAVEPPADPLAWVSYRVVSEDRGGVRFFADEPEADFPAARVLVEADAGVFTHVTRREVVARPAPGDAAGENAAGIELAAGSEVTLGAEQNGFVEISYEGRGTRGRGFVPADAVGLTYELAKRTWMPVQSRTFVAPGTKLLAAPKGDAFAEVTVPREMARPGVRYPVTVLTRKAGHALIALTDPWPESFPGSGPRARVIGWVKRRELLPEKKLPVLDLGGGALTGSGAFAGDRE